MDSIKLQIAADEQEARHVQSQRAADVTAAAVAVAEAAMQPEDMPVPGQPPTSEAAVKLRKLRYANATAQAAVGDERRAYKKLVKMVEDAKALKAMVQ